MHLIILFVALIVVFLIVVIIRYFASEETTSIDLKRMWQYAENQNLKVVHLENIVAHGVVEEHLQRNIRKVKELIQQDRFIIGDIYADEYFQSAHHQFNQQLNALLNVFRNDPLNEQHSEELKRYIATLMDVVQHLDHYNIENRNERERVEKLKHISMILQDFREQG